MEARLMHESKVEYLSPEAWKQWHTELLQSTLNRVYKRVPFYRKAMEKAGVSPQDIGSVEDLPRLPFTTRKDLSKNYPYYLFAVPLRDIVRIHTLRGSQKAPIVIGYTRQDLMHRIGLTQRFLSACGVTQDDIVQICLDPGMQVLGQELKEGAEALGALVIPPDPIHTSARLKVLVDFKTTVLITTPSYGLHLATRMSKAEIPIASLSLRIGIFVAETLTDQTREKLESEFSIKAVSGYGILEAVGPGMAYECTQKRGLHLALDHFIPEIIDPETKRPLGFGQKGELVITTVTTRANPLIRFRTGDITSIKKDKCPCGRTTWLMDPVSGRADDLVYVRGIKIDPEELKGFLKANLDGILPDHLLVIKRGDHLERLELWLALQKELFTGDLPELHQRIRGLETAFEEVMGIRCQIRPVEKRTISNYLEKGQGVWRMD